METDPPEGVSAGPVNCDDSKLPFMYIILANKFNLIDSRPGCTLDRNISLYPLL